MQILGVGGDQVFESDFYAMSLLFFNVFAHCLNFRGGAKSLGGLELLPLFRLWYQDFLKGVLTYSVDLITAGTAKFCQRLVSIRRRLQA